jgi:hypothetical protein
MGRGGRRMNRTMTWVFKFSIACKAREQDGVHTPILHFDYSFGWALDGSWRWIITQKAKPAL